MKSPEVELTILSDNVPARRGMRTAWGYSCLVRRGNTALLFDTGSDGKVLLHNMARLGVDPAVIPFVFISHEHWDHVGGVPALLQENRKAKFFLPAASDLPPVDLNGHPSRRIRKFEEILPGFYSTGSLAGPVVEQSLVVRAPEGLIVITGCAHPGIASIVETVHKALPKERLALVMGGFHLKSESEATIRRIIARLRALGVEYLAPSHCSGDLARKLFQQEWKEAFLPVGCGSRIRAGDSIELRESGR